MLSTLLLTAALATPVDHVFVQADVLNLRGTPSAKGALVARLRINTYLKVVSRRDGSIEVEIPNRPEEHPVRGWVLRGMVDPRGVQMKDALTRARTEKELATRRTWAERAVALDGSNDQAWHQLETVLEKIGDARALTNIKEARRGGHDVYIGICDGQRAVLAGRLRPGESLQSIPYQERNEKLLTLLGGASWNFHSGGHSGPVQGTPFPRPFKTASWNEANPNPYTSGGCEAICEEEEDAIILGPCQGGATIYSTAPMKNIQPEPLSLHAGLALLSKVAGSMHDHPTVSFQVAAVPGTLWRQVSVTSRVAANYDPWVNAGSWALIDAKGRIKTRLGPAWNGDVHWGNWVSNPRWFRLRLDGVDKILVVHASSSESGTGTGFTLIGPDGKVENMVFEHFGGGC